MSSWGERFLQRQASPRQRPVGVTALSVFFAAGTIPSSFSALALAFPGAWAEAIWRLKPDAERDFARLGSWAIPLMLLVAAACVGAAVGLWDAAAMGAPGRRCAVERQPAG